MKRGREFLTPYFYWILEKELSDQIEQIVAQKLPEAFITEMHLNHGNSTKLIVKVDTDAGISLAECYGVAKKIRYWLENEYRPNIDWAIEVSSPGLNTPLRIRRQYVKNIGRKLKVSMHDSSTLEGKLEAVTENHLTLVPWTGGKQKKRPKKASFERADISWEEIKESKVLPAI